MRNFGRLIKAWIKSHGWTALLIVTILLIFASLHFLAGGKAREIGYALVLTGLITLTVGIISFVRLGRKLHQLDIALSDLPEEANVLPMPSSVVEQRWREVACAYLKRYQDEAARNLADSREKSDYYTLWLHQIKTPLAALDLMAQSAGEVDRPLMRQELLKIEQYAGMALSYQRLESIHRDLDFGEVALYPVCCQAVRKLRPLFQYGQISLNMEPFEGTALTDAKWLTAVLTQVLTNALKYTPPRGSITVTMPEKSVLTVTDTGIGIRSEDVPRVFDRGFTGHTGRSHEKSTGIGLYLCKRICDELGHRIDLSSQVGKGTTVTLDLHRSRFEDMG